MNQSSLKRWFQFKASEIIYTVTAKEYMKDGFYVKIRFRNTVKPLDDWLPLRELRSCADEIVL